MNKEVRKVCYFGTYREEYSRNIIMIAGLREVGVEVVECHQGLWRGIEDRVQAVEGGWLHLGFIRRVIGTYWKLLSGFIHLDKDFDVLMVGYPGHFDVFLARILAWLWRKPLVWDVFMSIYLISIERGLAEKNKFTMALVRLAERTALRLPDLLIQDTGDYVDWLCGQYRINSDRFRLVPTGADDRIFKPQEKIGAGPDTFRVVYYGTFIPNHGVLQIIEAARELETVSRIKIILIGDGPERESAYRLTQDYRLDQVEFVGWMERERLVRYVGQADVCLGAFGQTPQSLMTVQNKIYEGLAMRMPVVSGESEAVRRAFKHGEEIFLCDRSDSRAIAAAILRLYQEPGLREKIARQGYARFQSDYALAQLGKMTRAHLQVLLFE